MKMEGNIRRTGETVGGEIMSSGSESTIPLKLSASISVNRNKDIAARRKFSLKMPIPVTTTSRRLSFSAAGTMPLSSPQLTSYKGGTTPPLLRSRPKDLAYYLILFGLIYPFQILVVLFPLLACLLTLTEIFCGAELLPQHIIQATHNILPFPALRMILLAWSWIETAYTWHYFQAKRHLNAHVSQPPPYSSARFHQRTRKEMMGRCLQLAAKDPEGFVSNWFFGTAVDEIGEEDMRRWLAWAAFSKKLEDVGKGSGRSDDDHDCSGELEELDYYLDEVERTISRARLTKSSNSATLTQDASFRSFRFSPGSTGCKMILQTLDEMKSSARPFIVYFFIISVDIVAACLLWLFGFRRRFSKDAKFSYWTVAPKTESGDPICFVHGIGIGLILYIPFLLHLKARNPGRKLVLLEFRHVSMQLETEIPQMEDTLNDIDEIYAALNIQKATWIGHSLGTVTCAWMVNQRPEKVTSVVFLDPVVFQIWEYDVAYNFLYRPAATAMDLLMQYFVAREVHLAHVLHRHFWWRDAVVFPEHLPGLPTVGSVKQPKQLSTRRRRKQRSYSQLKAEKQSGSLRTAVFVSEIDGIINAPGVMNHLNEAGLAGTKLATKVSSARISAPHGASCKVWMWEGFGHGAYLVHPYAWRDVADALEC